MIFPELISIRGQEDITKTESLLEQMQREIQGQKAFRPWTNGSHGSFGWCCWMLLKLGNNDVMIEEPFSIMFYLLNLLQFDISLEALWSSKCCRSQRFDTVQFKTCFWGGHTSGSCWLSRWLKYPINPIPAFRDMAEDAKVEEKDNFDVGPLSVLQKCVKDNSQAQQHGWHWYFRRDSSKFRTGYYYGYPRTLFKNV